MDQSSFSFIPQETKFVKTYHKDGVAVTLSVPPGIKNYPWNTVDKRSQVFSVPDLKLTVNKCCCGSCWCPTCGKNGSRRRIKERLRIFYWDSTRHVTLTIDRDQFASGQEAWKYVTEKKLIANMVWNLRRTAHVPVIDWLWVLEWHSGYPHWHLFLQVEKEDKAGMIGGDLLRKYWPWGRWVREQPIYSKNHWRSITGYFDKHGYFDKEKGVQGVLPEWAKDLVIRIKRYGSMVLARVDEDKPLKSNRGVRLGRVRRTYRMILEKCGTKTRVRVENSELKINMIVSVEYKALRKRLEGGIYYPGYGYFIIVEFGELAMLGELEPGILPLVDKILEIQEGNDKFFSERRSEYE